MRMPFEKPFSKMSYERLRAFLAAAGVDMADAKDCDEVGWGPSGEDSGIPSFSAFSP